MSGKKQCYFVDDEKRKEISNRIFYLRTKKNMTQKDLGIALAFFVNKNHEFRYSTISTWENGHPPRQKMLFCLADFFQVPPETFFLTEEGAFPENSSNFVEVVSPEASKDPSEELICQKLAQFNGQPVWCALDGNEMSLGAVGKWGIVCLESKSIVFSTTKSVRFSKVCFPIYRRPLQFEYAFEACGDSLSAEEVRRLKKVWVEPLGGDYDLRQRMKGFGEYFKYSDCVMMDSDRCAYPMSCYEKTFVCFKEEPKYTKETPLFDPTGEIIKKSAIEKVKEQKLLRNSK